MLTLQHREILDALKKQLVKRITCGAFRVALCAEKQRGHDVRGIEAGFTDSSWTRFESAGQLQSGRQAPGRIPHDQRAVQAGHAAEVVHDFLLSD